MKKVGIVLILMCLAGLPALAQAPDYQLIMNNLQSKLDALTAGAWSANAWTHVQGPEPNYNPPFSQTAPGFAGFQHILNGIPDDDHLALLQRVLEGDACTRLILGDAVVDQIINAYAANRANVENRETWFRLRLFNQTRIDIDYIISASNRPAYTDPAIQTFTTGQANTLRLCVDSGIFIIGTTCLSETVDIPSMWGADGLFNEASPGLGDDLADLMAAYLTIGSQAKVDYMQGMIFETMYRGFLPNIMEVILGLLKTDIDAEPIIEFVPEKAYQVDDKLYNPAGAITDVNIDESYSPPLVVSDDDPYIAIRRVVARVYNSGTGDDLSIERGVLQHFLHWYRVGANGFNAGVLARLGALGDLNNNGTANITAYNQAGGDRGQFIANAGAGLLFYFEGQPQQPAAPVDYGTQIFFNSNAIVGTGDPITYQWYSGDTPGALQPVPGANTSSYNPVVNFYSFGGTTNTRYYQVRAQTFACGENITLGSTTVAVTGGQPPPITVFTQPVASQNFFPGERAELLVNAGALAGTPWYQWQKYDEAFEGWFNIDPAENPTAATNNLVIQSITADDDGRYRCRIFNQVNAKNDDKANPVYFVDTGEGVFNVAPFIVFDTQPVGGSLDIGDDYSFTAEASVADGNLEYRWYKDGMPVTGWTDAGGTTVQAEYIILDAVVEDSGTYQLRVRNTLAPFGTYQANSANVALNVSSGTVYYVDPTGDNSDGLSWETAYWSLQNAIDAASVGDGGEVWVAGGAGGSPILYNEPRTVNWGGTSGEAGRVIGSLVMRSNVGLYGGFEGYRGGAGAQEGNRLQRDRAANVSVIDGSAARAGSPAYHVVVFGALIGGTPTPTVNAVLDGFVITGGDAAGIANDYHTWRGGGIYNWGSSPTIANCIITGNRAAVSGGGIANEKMVSGATTFSADATLVNVLIHGNEADRLADGGPGPDGGNPIRGGGGIFNNQSSPFMNFMTLVDNAVDNTYEGPSGDFGQQTFGLDSGGIFTWDEGAGTTPLVTNAIVHANTGSIVHQAVAGVTPETTVTYSIVEGGYAGTGNDDVDPLLGNAAYTALLGAAIGDFVPAETSPALDSGDPSIQGGNDLLGIARPLNSTGAPDPIVDRGAFELSLNGPAPACFNIALNFTAAPNTDFIDPDDVYDVENTVTEAPIVDVALDYYEFGCGDIPTTLITLVVTDSLGRTGTCQATVTVTESEPPVPMCNPITVQLDAAGLYTLDAADIAALSAGSTDNCTLPENLVVTVSQDTFTCAQAGQTVNISVFVEDESGNVASCQAPVTVEDNLPPTVPDPPNSISVDLLANGAISLSGAQIQQLATGATDNCAVDFGATQVSQTLFTCAHLGANTVDITIFDVNGNSVQGTAEVMVSDVTPPLLSGVVARNHVGIDGLYEEADARAGVTATDACDGDLTGDILVALFDAEDNPVAFPMDPDDGWFAPGEVTYDFLLRYEVTDNSANTAFAENTLTLLALQVPEITLDGNDPEFVECGTPYNDAGATAYDPEAEQDITGQMTTTVAVNINVPGTYTVTYSVDVPGYPELAPVTATRTVIVEDTIAPVITLHVADPLYWQLGEPFPNDASIRTAMDSCDGDLTAAIVTTGVVDVNTLGAYNLAFDVVDGEGNPADTVVLTVIVIEQLVFTEQPEGAWLYTDSAPIDLSASYQFGANVSGYEWFRDANGLGFIADTDTPNTVFLNVDPSAVSSGTYQYSVVVSDDSGMAASDNAEVRVAQRLSSPGLSDLGLAERASESWSVTINGGFLPRSVQWYANRADDADFVPVVDGAYDAGAYAGATTSTLQLTPFTEAMVGAYRVEVADNFEDTLVIGPANLILDFGVPAVGLFGLAALALATAIGGATAIRKRK